MIINTGLTPAIVRDSIARVRAGAESAGRSLDDVDLWWLPVANVRGDRAAAIDEVAMTLASAGSHLSRFTTEGKHIPPELHDAVVALGRRYRPEEHSKPDSSNRGLIRELGLLDYLAERFAITGTVEDCVAKIEAAAEAGARQFWMSIHFDDKERFLKRLPGGDGGVPLIRAWPAAALHPPSVAGAAVHAARRCGAEGAGRRTRFTPGDRDRPDGPPRRPPSPRACERACIDNLTATAGGFRCRITLRQPGRLEADGPSRVGLAEGVIRRHGAVAEAVERSI